MINRRKSSLLAWALSLLCTVAPTANLIIWLRAQENTPALFDLVESFGWGWALPITLSVAAALIITRQPGNRVGWLMMLPALVLAFSPSQFLAEPRSELTPALWLLLWLDTWSWIPVIFPILLIPLHFPTGRPPTPSWRWINWLAVAMWVIFMLLVAIREEIGPLNYDWTLSNPVGFLPGESLEGLFMLIWPAGLLAITIGSVGSLIVRYRHAGFVEREQIKWILYAAALLGIVYTINIVNNSGTDVVASAWMNLLLVLSVLAFPVAIAIAILRYRLFGIEVIIRKTAVYGVLTGLLALVYLGSVVLLQALFESVTGERSPVVIVISTLLIAALFAPLRRRVQTGIDRRFFRQKYDAQRVLVQFAQVARDEVELDALTSELLLVVQETMQPEHVLLWLKGAPKERGG